MCYKSGRFGTGNLSHILNAKKHCGATVFGYFNRLDLTEERS